jgi:hypothetical protein|eukprot:COSAG01_NODE_2355_length_7841_cov_647.664815_7_plen_77_part_00
MRYAVRVQVDDGDAWMARAFGEADFGPKEGEAPTSQVTLPHPASPPAAAAAAAMDPSIHGLLSVLARPDPATFLRE